MADIMPPPASVEQTPPEQFLARMARADACPDCCTNIEAPYRIRPEPVGFTAFYGCETCGYFWHTGWSDQ